MSLVNRVTLRPCASAPFVLNAVVKLLRDLMAQHRSDGIRSGKREGEVASRSM